MLARKVDDEFHFSARPPPPEEIESGDQAKPNVISFFAMTVLQLQKRLAYTLTIIRKPH